MLGINIEQPSHATTITMSALEQDLQQPAQRITVTRATAMTTKYQIHQSLLDERRSPEKFKIR